MGRRAVYNGLTDEWHPTQILADFLTIREHVPKPLDEVAFCYLGDARFNMAGTYLIGSAKLGMDVRIAAPDRSGREAFQSLAHEVAAKPARIAITGPSARPCSLRHPHDRRLGLHG